MPPEAPPERPNGEETAEEKLARAAQEELQGEGMPQSVRVHFRLGRHASEDDAASPEELEPYDVVMLESLGFSPSLEKSVQRVADGALSVNDFFEKHGANLSHQDYMRATLESLYESARRGRPKAVCFLDVPSRNRLFDDFVFHDATFTFPVYTNLDAPDALSKAADTFAEYLAKEAQLQKERESYMLKRFPKRLAQLVAEHPELAAKQTLHTLVNLGALHTGTPRAFSRSSYPASRQLPETPFVFSHQDQLVRSHLFGAKANDAQEHRQKQNAFLEAIVREAVNPDNLLVPARQSQAYIRYIRSIVDAMSDEQCVRFYDVYRRAPDNRDQLRAFLTETVGVRIAGFSPDQP